MKTNRDSPSPDELRTLLQFAATARQAEMIEAIIQHKTIGMAAKAIGVDRSVGSRIVGSVRKHAKRRGYDPKYDQTHAVPAGQFAKGVSTLYGEDGAVKAQWVKSQAEDAEREAVAKEMLAALLEDVPRAKPIKAPKGAPDDLCNLHVLTDFHLGAYSWHEETGEDWDLNIAEKLLVDWFAYAIKQAPSARVGVLAQLGDFTHYDGFEALTPTNKHLLDADSRFPKMVRVAIRAQRQIHRMLLEKYEHLHLIVADANHDPASAVWQREMFAEFYADEPRITVDRSPDTYYCYEHGLTALFFHHGHKRAPKAIDDVFVAKFRDVFGRTKFAYGHMGHLHHKLLLETNLMLVEQHETMAAKDAYASRGGYMSKRGASCISYSKRYGEVGRQVTTPGML